MPKFIYTNIYEIEARGGLSAENIAKDPNLRGGGYSPTRSGRFTILSIGKHVSSTRWMWSSVPWGAPVRMDIDAVYVQINNKWRKLSTTHRDWLAPYKGMPNPEKELKKMLEKEYTAQDGTGNSYSSIYGQPKLTSWIFNDFGHVSIKYFRDNNKNGRFDQGTDEVISDFIHTTPATEAATKYHSNHPTGRAPYIPLDYSHGCIHVKPNDVDILIGRGFAKKGNVIEIHPYSAAVAVKSSFERTYGNPQYELHFFPGKSADVDNLDGGGKLIVYSVKKL
jgi:hypothetical protein